MVEKARNLLLRALFGIIGGLLVFGIFYGLANSEEFINSFVIALTGNR